MTLEFAPFISPWLDISHRARSRRPRARSLRLSPSSAAWCCGTAIRIGAAIAVLAALVNPLLMHERGARAALDRRRHRHRRPQPESADRWSRRKAQTDQAMQPSPQTALGRFKNIETRIIEAGRDRLLRNAFNHALLEALAAANLTDVPPSPHRQRDHRDHRRPGPRHPGATTSLCPASTPRPTRLITGKEGRIRPPRRDRASAPRFGLDQPRAGADVSRRR